MPAKKLTARKRAELERKKIKEQKKSNFPIRLILFIIIIVVIIGIYFIFLNNGTDGNNHTSNTAPSATEDSSILSINSTNFQIDALANDNDLDGDNLIIISVTNPSHGTASTDGNYTYYTPDPYYNGPDSFTYTISDGHGGSDIASVKLTVTFINDPPSATEDFSVLSKNIANFQIDVLANDNDPNNDELNITTISIPSHGIAELMNGSIYYTPETNFSGVDSIQYKISDGENEVTAKVHIIIADVYPIALIDTSKGTIVVELYEDKVQDTCANFIKLADDGFYEGLVFHRVIDDFMIQGGGFNTDGTQKQSPYGTIDLEINPEVRHVDGAIAMARTNDPNSATSQFYICDGAQAFLDDQYAAFGKTIDGIDIVRAISSVATTTKNGMQDWPVEDVLINSITIENQ